jgi:type IV pilus assembly protein PilO
MLNALQNLWRNFETMDRDAPMAWPRWLRRLTYPLVCLVVVGLLWVLHLSADQQTLKRAEVEHARLRMEFSAKLQRVAPLASLQNQQSWLRRRLESLEKQLPDSRGMAMLLADMSQAGRDRNLRFDWLRPQELKNQPLYAQQRIDLRVVGRYEDLAGFVADLAGLDWLVTVQRFSLLPDEDGVLVLDALVRTLRPLNMKPSQAAEKGAR